MPLTPLQLEILDVMMDDYEDVEQVYLSVNRNAFERNPCVPQFRLRDVIDDLKSLLAEGLVELAPSQCQPAGPEVEFHEQWFFPTDKGREAWKHESGRHSK